MKLGILTIVAGDRYEKIWERSEPFFQAYAKKCGADLVVLTGEGAASLPSPHWLKFSIHELLRKDYNRIAFIDADIIIRDDAPSLFDVVPEDSFGIFNEGEFMPRAVCIHEVMKVYKIEDLEYDGRTYYNTGVMVVSRRHRFIFNVTEDIKPLRNHFGEQTFLNLKIMIARTKMHNLNYKFNRMSHMDRVSGMTRLDSYLIHYAGDGDNLLKKMDRDIQKWKEANGKYEYRRKLFIWALGGLGDCIAAEPSIRYMREQLHNDADIWLMSIHHDIYSHIDINRSLSYPKDYPEDFFDAIIEVNTHQLPWEDFGKYAPFQFVHCVDWVSMVTMGRMLPDKDKEIRLTFDQEAMNEVLAVDDSPEDLILVHPGIGWESKTFPLEYWQGIIDGLLDEGFRVGIIGKRGIRNEKLKSYHSVLEVDASRCVDFRDKLSMKGLCALISRAKTLISNDSAPIHVAGAYDNNIILIPTCKHPDHILPYRNGSKHYKAKALYKKIIEDDVVFGNLAGDVFVSSYIPQGHVINEYLPEVEEVISTVKQFDGEHEESCFPCRQEKENYNVISLESVQ
jgi:lipopolysaccharide biosynthesis glycosyltransferase